MFKIIAIVAVAVVALIFTFTQIDPELNQENGDEIALSYNDENYVQVIVDGQVVNPGSYSVLKSSTIKELVEKAGGFLESADKEAILLDTEINDRTLVYIPPKSNFQTECEIEAQKEKININEATAKELSSLDGVSLTLGEKIVSYREENGPFLTIEDVKLVSGIGDATYQKIRDYIRLK